MVKENQVVKKQTDIYALLDMKGSEIAKVLPKHITREKALRLVATTLRRNETLAKAAVDNPVGFFSAVIQVSQLGLTIDGRNAHLVPYRNKGGGYDIVPIIDYKGFVQLVLRSGQYSYVHADAVCENDEFDENLGQVLTHKINRKEPRGEAYAYYAMARTKEGDTTFCVMSKDEINKVRASSKASSSGPWVDWYDEMAKKTVFKRLCKWLTLSPEMQDAVEADDHGEEERFQAARPIFDAAEPVQIEAVEGKAEAQSEAQEGPPTEAEQLDSNVAKLMDLIMASPVDSKHFVEVFVSQNQLQPGQKITDLSPAMARVMVPRFKDIEKLAAEKGGGK